MRAGFVIALAVAALTTLSGCASQSYLYNAERDKQGQTAQKAAGDAKLTDVITAVEKRNARLLDLELDAMRTRYAHIRDLEIREVAFSSDVLGNTLLRRVDDRLTRLYGGSFKAVVDLQNELATETTRVRTRREVLEDEVRPAPDCETADTKDTLPTSLLANLKPEKVPEVEGLYRRYREVCRTWLTARSKYQEALRKADKGSLLADAIDRVAQDEAAQKKAEDDRAKAREALKNAENEFKLATASLPATTDYAEKIATAIKKLKESLDKIESAQERVGTEVVAKARLDRIDEILDAASGGKVDTSKWDPDLRTAVGVAATLPALLDEASRMLREAAKPRLVPFELARQHQRLVLEEVVAVNAVLALRIKASNQILDASIEEAKTLVAVRKVVEPSGGQTLDSLAALDAPTRRALYEALGRYFDDVPRFQRDQKLWEYRYYSTRQDLRIVYSKYAALMWQNLNEGVAATLASYHGSGIKPETIAEFAKAFGIILIGIGVN